MEIFDYKGRGRGDGQGSLLFDADDAAEVGVDGFLAGIDFKPIVAGVDLRTGFDHGDGAPVRLKNERLNDQCRKRRFYFQRGDKRF